MNSDTPTPVGESHSSNSLMLALVYAAFAGMWILFSDQVLIWLFSDPADYAMASTLKGLLFVVVTTLLLYGLIRRLEGGVAAISIGKGLGWPSLLMVVLVVGLTAVVIHHSLGRGEGLVVAAWIGMAGLLTLIALGAVLLILRQRAQLQLAQATRIAQEERLRALKLLTAIADSSEDDIFALDLDGRFVMANWVVQADTGKTMDELFGKDESSLFPPEVAAALMDDNQWVLAHGVSRSVEETLPLAAGERTLLTTKSPLRDQTGKIIGLLGISRDITERKRSEVALRESEERFRALVEQTLAGIYIIQDGYFRYVNPGFASLFGYASPEQIIDQLPVQDLVAEEDRERVAENVRRREQGEISDIHYVFVGLRRDGSRIDVEVHGRAFAYQGSPAVIGLMLDITASKAAEDALRASELRFHDIVNASADWIWEIDTAGRYTYASESVLDMLGHTPAEILGKTPFDLMPPEEAERLRAQFADIMARRASFRDLDNINLHKDGSLRHVSTNGIAILAADGALLGYRGLDRDITDKRLAQLALEESGNRLRTLINTLPDLVWLKDTSGVYLACNPRFEAFFGAREADIIGKSDHDFVPAELADFFRARDQAAIAADGPSSNEEEVTFACDGHREWLHTIKTPIRDSAGKVIGVLGIARDISERKKAETSLLESEARFRTLFENAAVAIMVHDSETGEVLEANRRAIDSYGFSSLEELQRNDFWLEPPYSHADALALIHKAAAGEPQRFEWKNADRHGEVFWEEVLLNHMSLNAADRVLSIATDITDRKAAEAELKTRNEELQRFNRATVGRELDMLEMKKAINALSRELGRAAPYPLAFLNDEEGR